MKFKKLTSDAITPTYGTDGAAAFDLSSTSYVPIPAGHAATVPTGLSFEVPEGQVMLVFSRSGHGFKNAVRLANCVGVIDSDFRGEVMVRLANDGHNFYDVKVGERIAQAMVIPVSRCDFEEVKELTATKRGAKGFGSTGK